MTKTIPWVVAFLALSLAFTQTHLLAQGQIINSTVLSVWFNATASYGGGPSKCGESTCHGGTFYRANYACSGAMGGNWNNGQQFFHDPLWPGYLVTGAYVTLVGNFHCFIDSPNATVEVSINNMQLNQAIDLPVKPFDGCLCPNCVDTFTWPTFDYEPGWPTYNYNGTNQVAVVVENSAQQQICLAEVIVHLKTERVIPEPQALVPAAIPVGVESVVTVQGLYFRDDLVYRCRFGNQFPTQPFATYLNPRHVACNTPAFPAQTHVSVHIEPSLTTQPLNIWSAELKTYWQPLLYRVDPHSAHANSNVTITGANMTFTDAKVLCRFGSTLSPGFYVNTTSVICIVPEIQTNASQVSLDIAVALNGQDFAPTGVGFIFISPIITPWTPMTVPVSPWIWGVIGAAALVLIVAAVVGLVIYVRRRKPIAAWRGYQRIPDGFEAPPKDIAINPKEIKIYERIGRGSFGDIYRGEWRGSEVAVKKIAYNNMSEKFIQELWREANLMKTMRHPNMIQLMGVCAEPPEISIVMEFMARGSLYTLLHNPTVAMSWDLRLKIALDAARGMNYLHCSNPIVMHRDLKSHNLLVDDGWRVKVSDFGLSRMIEDVLSATMTVCGTPCWTAPEVLRNQKYSVKADVYSFGICLWEMCTRQDPYNGLPPFQVVVQVATKGLRPDIPPDCPKEWEKLMVDCWAEDETTRPTFQEIVDRLAGMTLEDVDHVTSTFPGQPLSTSHPSAGVATKLAQHQGSPKNVVVKPATPPATYNPPPADHLSDKHGSTIQ